MHQQLYAGTKKLKINIDGKTYKINIAEITFNFWYTDYTALPYMTWREWIESDYNTSESTLYIDANGYVRIDSSSNLDYFIYEIPPSTKKVLAEDLIREVTYGVGTSS